MKWILIDGLFRSGGHNNHLVKLMKQLNSHSVWYSHSNSPYSIDVASGDCILAYSLGGNTAVDLVRTHPEINFSMLIALEPVFGWNFFGKNKVIPNNVDRFLQIKSSSTLWWAKKSFYVREQNKIESPDLRMTIQGNHNNIASQPDTLKAIKDFIGD